MGECGREWCGISNKCYVHSDLLCLHCMNCHGGLRVPQGKKQTLLGKSLAEKKGFVCLGGLTPILVDTLSMRGCRSTNELPRALWIASPVRCGWSIRGENVLYESVGAIYFVCEAGPPIAAGIFWGSRGNHRPLLPSEGAARGGRSPVAVMDGMFRRRKNTIRACPSTSSQNKKREAIREQTNE